MYHCIIFILELCKDKKKIKKIDRIDGSLEAQGIFYVWTEILDVW